MSVPFEVKMCSSIEWIKQNHRNLPHYQEESEKKHPHPTNADYMRMGPLLPNKTWVDDDRNITASWHQNTVQKQQ